MALWYTRAVGYVDLHSHYVPNVDDGVRSTAEGVALLRRLGEVGFETVVATPHMRPGMFDNDRALLQAAFTAFEASLSEDDRGSLPARHLASEHYFDDVTFERLVNGAGLPYPGGRSVLVEMNPTAFPIRLPERLADLKRRGLVPVIAHPERYQPVWTDRDCVDALLDVGACLLLDVCALVGKYGAQPQRAAEKLIEEDAYEAACSDAHRPSDADEVERAIVRLQKLVGKEEAKRLLDDGPRRILAGTAGG
ncbi:capsular polysaccharide biosynthesis protein [soil metagenome]